MIPLEFMYVSHVLELDLSLTLQWGGGLLVCPWVRPFSRWGWGERKGKNGVFVVALEMLVPAFSWTNTNQPLVTHV